MSSEGVRWGGLVAVLGGVLLMSVDPAVTGVFTGQQTLLTLGTVLLSGGLAAFLVGFVGTGFLAGLDPNRRVVTLASIALGIYCLFAVPVYYLVFTDALRVFGGESPGCVLLGLILVPLLVRSGSAKALLGVTLISVLFLLMQVLAAFLALELPGGGLTTTFSEAGQSVPLFERVEGCTLIMCGLDHVLFHFSQIPFLAIMALFSHRAYRTAYPETRS
jgi:hypothetical protein